MRTFDIKVMTTNEFEFPGIDPQTELPSPGIIQELALERSGLKVFSSD
jgi:hypothetical protein